MEKQFPVLTKPDLDDLHHLWELISNGNITISVNNFQFMPDTPYGKNIIKITYFEEEIAKKEVADESDEYSQIYLRTGVEGANKFGVLDFDKLKNYIEILNNHSEPSDIRVDSSYKWEYVPNSNHIFEWETEYDQNSLYIDVESTGILSNSPSYLVNGPVEDKNLWGVTHPHKKDIDVSSGNISFDSLASAYLYTVMYMYDWNPIDLDMAVRMEEIALEEFQELPGVGKQTAQEFVQDRHIRTYYDLKKESYNISSNYRGDAVQQMNEKIESEEYIRNNDYVKKPLVDSVSESL